MAILMTDQCTQCQEVVAHLVKRHQWQLLPTKEFALRLHQRVIATGGEHHEGVLTTQAINLYCIEWYEACASEGERQERAFAELSRYLYDRALYQYKDAELATEFVQEALFRVFRLLHTCKNPGAFLTFTMFKVRQAATDYFRKRDRERLRTETLSEDQAIDRAGDGTNQFVDSTRLPLVETVIDVEKAEAVLERIAELIAQNPRAKNQFLAVILKYLYDWSDKEIARELGISVGNVHILRNRGRKRLGNDPVLSELWSGLS